MNDSTVLMDVRSLRTYLRRRTRVLRAVDGATFSIRHGEALGLVGESGSGKSMICQSIMRIEPRPAAVIEGGEVVFEGEDLLQKDLSQMRHIRGCRIGMIFQDPMNSLNPVLTIGNQLIESLRMSHPRESHAMLRERAWGALDRVGIRDAKHRLDAYPFEFSGGMRQRVSAAIAISRRPKLLIADEPTTALDVTTQARFLRLLDELRRADNMSLLLVTHDLGIVAATCDRVAVMYAGRIVEMASARQILASPRHPYTQSLLQAVPHLQGPRKRRLFHIPGEPPDASSRAAGCRFAPRCNFASEICRTKYPPSLRYSNGDTVACWLHVPKNDMKDDASTDSLLAGSLEPASDSHLPDR